MDNYMDRFNEGEMTPEEILEIIKKFNSFLTLKGRPCVSLKRQLERLPVAELRALSRDYRVDAAGLKKAELIDQIFNAMVEGSAIKGMLLALSRETRDFLLHVAKEKNGKYETEMESPDLFYMALQWGLMGMYREDDHFVFVVTKEMRETLGKVMDDEDFAKILYQYETLEITLHACVNLYGIIKREDVIDVFQKYFPENTLQESADEILSGFIADRDWVCAKGGYLCFPFFEEAPDSVIDENYHIAKSNGRYYPSFDDFIQYCDFDYEEASEGAATLFGVLNNITRDEFLAEEIINSAVTIFRTGGDIEDFDALLINEWMDEIGEENFAYVSETAEFFSGFVHSWIYCGYSFNDVCGVPTKPSLSVIEGGKPSRSDSKNETDQDQHPDDHKPKLRLL